ncbi:MAG: hypothetical protein AAFV53_23200 [Myxococcota bacterium]
MASSRSGCFGLLALPFQLLLGGGSGNRARRPAQIPTTGLTAEEMDAVRGARDAADRTWQRLHAPGQEIDPNVLDQVGGTIDQLAESVERMAHRLADARAWSSRHDPAAIQRELTDLEMDDGPGLAARLETMKVLRERARAANDIAIQIPRMSARLRAAAGKIQSLEARFQAETLRNDLGAMLEQLEHQRADSERALHTWTQTLNELRALT